MVLGRHSLLFVFCLWTVLLRKPSTDEMPWLCRLPFSWWLFILKFNPSNWRIKRQQNALQSAMISVPVECMHVCNSYWNDIWHPHTFLCCLGHKSKQREVIFIVLFFNREIRICQTWLVHNTYKRFSKSVLLFHLVFYWQNYICLNGLALDLLKCEN